MDAVLQIAPKADRVEPPAADGSQRVLTADGEVIGFASQTLPQARSVVGYRGPSNTLLLLDEDSAVIAAGLLQSDDTVEHVAAVESDEAFFQQFVGWKQGEPETFTSVDATSGATLTALAIAEGIAVRLGSEKPSLRFPENLTEADVSAMFEDQQDLRLQPVSNYEAEVYGNAGQMAGRLFRTGPLCDSLAGYQGPSEVLIATDPGHNVTGLRLRNTFDNQPYAGYLNEEEYFWKVFLNQPFVNLRQLDLEAEQVEGVSGATMTSMAVAQTIVKAASKLHQLEQRRQADINRRRIHWGLHDTGTICVLAAALLIGFTHLRGIRWLQVVWLLVLVLYFGLTTGNLISMAVIFGWATHGIAWKLAPGLTAVLAVSMLVPPVSRRNIYCSHVCPHGALQQVLRQIKTPVWKPKPAVARELRKVPGILVAAAVMIAALGFHGQLASWEPFDAWIWYVSGSASLVIAALGLLWSAFTPMAWCRYGCATGRILDYVRRSARSPRFTLADGILVFMTIIAAITAWRT